MIMACQLGKNKMKTEYDFTSDIRFNRGDNTWTTASGQKCLFATLRYVA